MIKAVIGTENYYSIDNLFYNIYIYIYIEVMELQTVYFIFSSFNGIF